MNSGLQKRLYEIEVTPPASVWEKLSANIDEINADNIISRKVLDAELTPPVNAWEQISIAIDPEEKKERSDRVLVVNFKRLAAAAIFIGIIITTWFVFKNNNGKETLAGVQVPAENKNTADSNTSKNPAFTDSPIEKSTEKPTQINVSKTSLNKVFASNQLRQRDKRNFSGNRNEHIAQQTTAQFASLNEPLGKSFNQPIDDLSLVTSDQNYLTMVNANGRLVKIPAQFANLAPHLQNKPVSEDYYEVMFGEGTYWKETLNEWRKKVASLPVSSGDAFTSFIELLKTVQDK